MAGSSFTASQARRPDSRPRSLRSAQRGAALLLGLLLVATFAIGLLLPNLTINGVRLDDGARTSLALATARDALIARAVLDNDRPGALPCPDTDNDGRENSVAGNCTSGYVGRLPWVTLRTGELTDGAGERLWYVLTNRLRDNAAAEPINAQTSTALSLDGRADIAAIVYAAGPALPGQDGRPGNTRADYLDGVNASTTNAFVSGPASPIFNDRALAITRDELFVAVGRRVLAEIRGPDDSHPAGPGTGLRYYHNNNGEFPYADTNGDGLPDGTNTAGTVPYQLLPPVMWLFNNQWFALVSYERISDSCVHLSLPGIPAMSVVPCPTSPCPNTTCP